MTTPASPALPVNRLVGGATEREWIVLVIKKLMCISWVLVTSLENLAGLKTKTMHKPCINNTSQKSLKNVLGTLACYTAPHMSFRRSSDHKN